MTFEKIRKKINNGSYTFKKNLDVMTDEEYSKYFEKCKKENAKKQLKFNKDCIDTIKNICDVESEIAIKIFMFSFKFAAPWGFLGVIEHLESFCNIFVDANSLNKNVSV